MFEELATANVDLIVYYCWFQLLTVVVIYYNKLFQSSILPMKLVFLQQCILVYCGTSMLTIFIVSLKLWRFALLIKIKYNLRIQFSYTSHMSNAQEPHYIECFHYHRKLC